MTDPTLEATLEAMLKTVSETDPAPEVTERLASQLADLFRKSISAILPALLDAPGVTTGVVAAALLRAHGEQVAKILASSPATGGELELLMQLFADDTRRAVHAYRKAAR